MAINLIEKQSDKSSSKYSSGSAWPSRQSVKLKIATDGSITSSDSKSIKTNKKSNPKSPYLSGDSVQLLSRIKEKKLYSQHKKCPDILLSFPLAANIYKANSDEFKTQKKSVKKVKKSVLTLPNTPSSAPQTCTVSDINDSEYCNGSEENRKLKAKKLFVQQNKKYRVRDKNYEFYDRDARYCSQMKITLDCSSTDLINPFPGYRKSEAGKFHGGKLSQNDQEFNAHDVWAALRNINRFQFKPSPAISEDSIHTPKKKKRRNRKRNNRKDTRVIETCRTEEFAYISSFEVDSKSPRSFSKSSSFDRITVIDKQDEFSEICKEFEKSVIKTKNIKEKNRYPININKNQIKKNTKNNLKAIGYKEQNEVQGLQNKHLKYCNKSRDTKAPESQPKEDSYENTETLVMVNYDSKVESPPENQYAEDLRNQDNADDIKVIVNRALESDYSCSESSKVGITSTRKDCNCKSPKISSDESGPHVKGITKVILGKGQSLVQSKMNEMFNRKPRLATPMPITTFMPKLTQTEIKRRLANLKFPIAILGKDQLSSAPIQVMSNDPAHLGGLNQPIWPFMQDWYEQTNPKKDKSDKDNKKAQEKGKCDSPRNKHQGLERKNHLRKINEVHAIKQSAFKEKNYVNVECAPNKKKSQKRPMPFNEITKIKPQQTKKLTPIHQLKDKKLKILEKNSSARDIDEQYKKNGQGNSNNDAVYNIETNLSNHSKKFEIGTETVIKCEFVAHGLSRNANVNLRPKMKMPIITQPRAKVKWASDFIDNVLNKIRSGIYFTQENKHLQKASNSDLKEASIQTVLAGKNFSVNDQFVELDPQVTTNEVVPYQTNNFLDTLPGFDDSLPALEIKTMNMKEVAVQYCTTNIIVQFDVAVPSVPDNLYNIQNSTSFVPLAITESHTKVFKCKTTIVNAMLPAEICSLLPKIFRSILDLNNTHTTPHIPAKFQNESPLYTICELGTCESPDIYKSALLPQVSNNILPNLLKLLNGVFSKKKSKKRVNDEMPKVCYNNNSFLTKDLLLDVSVHRLLTINVNLLSFGMPNAGLTKQTLQIRPKMHYGNGISKINTCTTLDLYRERNPMINVILSYNLNKSKNLWRSMIPTFPIPLDVTLDHNKIIVTLKKNTNDDDKAIIDSKSIKNNIKVDLLFNGLTKHNNNASELKALKYKNHAENNKSNMKKVQNQVLMISTKSRKKSFVMLYKKCKSTTNISGERHSTSLSKIVNLDDFFQALGSGKLLSSVFDGLSGKKILSSITEMKNWITDISQRQAMLVLLLTNKKDTPNLVRFRPILLQGIAVNRITRASELDMEIEVIERENFNKFSQYDGISCLKESVDNQDNLIEELYWIAKTTASDYQRPFNEASEKLLKSLLEKRKKLNPSYLRVMARYVGLGLLKSPKN